MHILHDSFLSMSYYIFYQIVNSVILIDQNIVTFQLC